MSGYIYSHTLEKMQLPKHFYGTTYELLEAALDLIRDPEHWERGRLQSQGRFCAAGAVIQVGYGSILIPSPFSTAENPIAARAYHALTTEAFRRGYRGVAQLNDRTNHAEVVSMFQATIRAEKAKYATPAPAPVRELPNKVC